jgi:hypothetical protein
MQTCTRLRNRFVGGRWPKLSRLMGAFSLALCLLSRLLIGSGHDGVGTQKRSYRFLYPAPYHGVGHFGAHHHQEFPGEVCGLSARISPFISILHFCSAAGSAAIGLSGGVTCTHTASFSPSSTSVSICPTAASIPALSRHTCPGGPCAIHSPSACRSGSPAASG